MSTQHYEASWDDFALRPPLRPGNVSYVQGIVERPTSLGTAAIQLPSRDPHFVSEVTFLLTRDTVASFRSRKHIVDNGRDNIIRFHDVGIARQAQAHRKVTPYHVALSPKDGLISFQNARVALMQRHALQQFTLHAMPNGRCTFFASFRAYPYQVDTGRFTLRAFKRSGKALLPVLR